RVGRAIAGTRAIAVRATAPDAPGVSLSSSRHLLGWPGRAYIGRMRPASFARKQPICRDAGLPSKSGGDRRAWRVQPLLEAIEGSRLNAYLASQGRPRRKPCRQTRLNNTLADIRRVYPA